MTDTAQLRPRIWIYRRSAPGELHPVPTKKWDLWVFGKASLPPSEDGFVWFVSVIAWGENRNVARLGQMDFWKSRVDERGVHSEELKLVEMRVTMQGVWAKMGDSWSGKKTPTEPQTVVDATSRFQAQQYKWKPTPEDARALRDILNRRVGWEVIP
ncbi:hypothetical protein [Myxococcus qinghaiensis]|uniref:hypothetical protein n=1 Tax=Myxococcus qinghaiensis TaxID=2906758 RepID=UPI0020A6F5C2|nr:hypothetical protein [Myxococcus qinghaiensis]MCP3163140.1 hypothetical protein [Myxococcus qinghaiensis]